MANGIVAQQSAEFETVSATDPNLREGTVTAETVTVCGYTLPPILKGVQPGLDLDGEPMDYRVKVIRVSRNHVDRMLFAISENHPELAQPLEIVSTYMMHLDTMREEAALGTLATLGWLRKEQDKHPQAFANLETVARMLGHWGSEARLHLPR